MYRVPWFTKGEDTGLGWAGYGQALVLEDWKPCRRVGLYIRVDYSLEKVSEEC